MNKIGYIYKITNKVNGKIYIGKTKSTINNRWKQHLKSSEDYKNSKLKNSKLYSAMNKYGIENFKIEEIESCDYSILSEKEIYWITILNSRDSEIGYNICKGGECGPGGPRFKGHKHSLETRQKMSENRKGIKNSNYGNHWKQSDELKEKHSKLSKGENNGMYGKKQTEESKQKISNSNKNKICMTNGEKDVRIHKDQIEYYENLGFWYGRTFAHKKKNTV